MNAVMSKLPLVARLLLGLVFFVFGLNGFLHFLPMPELPATAMGFMKAMIDTGYLLALVKGTEVVCGLALLTGRFVPLALVVLAPVTLNILLFHVVLAPAGMGMAVVLTVLQIYLMWAYRDAFAAVVQPVAKPR